MITQVMFLKTGSMLSVLLSVFAEKTNSKDKWILSQMVLWYASG